MSIAQLQLPEPTTDLRAVADPAVKKTHSPAFLPAAQPKSSTSPVHATQPKSPSTPVHATHHGYNPNVAAKPHTEAAPSQPRKLHAVPDGTEARGFALYVGIDENKAIAAGVDLSQIVTALKRLVGSLAPGAETYATVALAPVDAGGRDVDVVRLALQDPSAVAKHRDEVEPEPAEPSGVVVDISRKRVLIDDDTAPLTFKEFELLQYLVLREGRTIERAEIISALWNSRHDGEAPNERTIDVHVRRLRAKLGQYEDIVRTVRGVGYRYDKHADVSVRYASAPSPDLF